MRAPPRAPRGIAIVVLSTFLVAFVVRVAWLQFVQSPFDTVYSDMAMYVERAQMVLAGQMPPDPRLMAIYPPGTHAILALEFLAFGRDGRIPISLVHAAVSAIPAATTAATAFSFVRSRWVALIAGLLVAFWYPQVAFVGFFSSEVWFSAAIAIHAWLTAQDLRRPASLLAVGMVAALAFVVRPQFLMTWGTEVGCRAVMLLRRRGLRPAARTIGWLVLPVLLMITYTGSRFHHLSGHWGLIAESAGNRLWADTDVCQIEGTWQAPNGETLSYWFSPPSKPAHTPENIERFEGFIADPVILDRIRRERMRGTTWTQLLSRRLGNVKLLFLGNLPWPESNYHDDVSFLGETTGISRYTLQEHFRDALLYVVFPLAALGVILGRKSRAMLILVANLTTMVVCAAFFFGEARYHVPYDPFAILLAVVGICEIGRRIRRAVGRRLGLRKALHGSPAAV